MSSHQAPYNTRHPQENLRELSFWQDDETQNGEDPESWPDRPSPFKFVIAITGLVVLAGIFWFAYRWVSQPNSDAPALIQAEPGPFKVKPENPGGASIPHQDKLIYGRITPGTEQPVERLLPPPEQPTEQPVPTAPTAYASVPHQAPQQQQPTYVIVDPKTGVMQHVYAAPAAPSAPTPAPVSSDGMVYVPVQQQPHQGAATHPQQGYYAYPPLPTEATHQGVPQSVPQSPQPIPPQVHVQPNHHQNGLSEITPSPQQVSSDPANMAKTEEKQRPKTAEKTSAQTGNFYIQMATLPNKESATVEANRLGRKADLMETPPFIRATSGPDVKFRVLAGPFNSKTDAVAKCNKLGMGCRVVDLPVVGTN
jgi:hypothetical protein